MYSKTNIILKGIQFKWEKNLYIDASHPDETRIVLKSNNTIEEYEYEDKNKINFKNNIYLGTISRVEPSLQAAFVDFGRIKHGFLAFNDIQSDYYQIPLEDKEKLKNLEEKIREDLKNTNIEEVNSLSDNQNIEKNENTNNEKDDGSNNEIKKGAISSPGWKTNYREKLKNTYGLKKYRIQEVIKPGQVILVQVLKERERSKRSSFNYIYFLSGKIYGINA